MSKRGRPPKTPENDGLMPWEEVARRVGLSVKETRRIADEAMEKLKLAFVVEGINKEFVQEYRRMKEDENGV